MVFLKNSRLRWIQRLFYFKIKELIDFFVGYGVATVASKTATGKKRVFFERLQKQGKRLQNRGYRLQIRGYRLRVIFIIY